MSNLSVLQVQQALREAAEQGHDLTLNNNMLGLHGRMYPTMFKGLDIGGLNNTWTAYSAIPHENASVQFMHLNSESETGPLHMYSLIPHMTSYGKGSYAPNSVGNYYVGANLHTHLRDNGYRPDHVLVDRSGALKKPYFDEKGNDITNVHEHIAHNARVAMRGIVDDSEIKASRPMTQEEMRLHKTLVVPGKGLVSSPLVRTRVSPVGMISINHYTGRYLEQPGLEQHLYDPVTETLRRIG